MTKKNVSRVFIGIILVLGVSILIQTIYYISVRSQKKINHEKVLELVDEDITYEEASLDETLETLEDWIANKKLYDEDLGRLYERESNVYKFQGDTLNYYKTMGYALYYLDKSGDQVYSVNLYLDLVTFYISNFAYDRAEEIMDQIYDTISLSRIEDYQVKSYAYRVQGILQEHNGDYSEAERSLTLARQTVDQSHTGIWEEAYYAMIDANLAKVYFDTDRNDKARNIMGQYEDSPLFTQTAYASVLVRDFIIPYYEVKCYLAVQDLDSDGAKEIIDIYVGYCEEYGYQKNELNTLLYLMENLPPEDPQIEDTVYDLINDAYLVLTDMQTDDYTSLIESQVANAESDEAAQAESETRDWKRLQTYLMSTMFLIMIGFLVRAIVRNEQRDGLTGVQTRGAFNRALGSLMKRHAEYAVIMMDIDDFKKVNDTYGHQAGDQVLTRIGEILLANSNTEVRAYRYGGEEFVLLLTKYAIHSASITAENVRRSVEEEQWGFTDRITISLGIAVSGDEDDVVKRADDSLYESKKNGKNQVTYKR